MRAVALTASLLFMGGCNADLVVLRDQASPDAGLGPAFEAPLGNWTLSVAVEHSCAISGGALYCWGSGADGRLGTGTAIGDVAPVRVSTSTDWALVTTGDAHSCALNRAGRVFCAGANAAGQLGIGDTRLRKLLAPVGLPEPARDVQARANHTCAVLQSGALWCWGANGEGQLGLGDTFPGADQPSPVLVPGGAQWRTVAPGQGHTCGIQRDGSLWCWGRNSGQNLGLGPGAPMQLRVPQRVGTDTDWDAVVSTVDGSCALRSDHSLWCWGTDPGRAQSFAAPTQSGTDTDWGLIRIDVYHACALKLSGALFCRGRGSEGQLGRANLEPSPDFVAIEPAQRYSAVSVGRYHTCARSSAGVVSCTGKNDIGQLGVGDQQLRKVLTEVRPFP